MAKNEFRSGVTVLRVRVRLGSGMFRVKLTSRVRVKVRVELRVRVRVELRVRVRVELRVRC